MIQEYTGQHIEYGIVKFSSPSCGPCNVFAPEFEIAARASDLPFYEADVSKRPDLRGLHGAATIPAVFTVDNGVWHKWGFTPMLEELIQEAKLLRQRQEAE